VGEAAEKWRVVHFGAALTAPNRTPSSQTIRSDCPERSPAAAEAEQPSSTPSIV
jgi:hypothetical protein